MDTPAYYGHKRSSTPTPYTLESKQSAEYSFSHFKSNIMAECRKPLLWSRTAGFAVGLLTFYTLPPLHLGISTLSTAYRMYRKDELQTNKKEGFAQGFLFSSTLISIGFIGTSTYHIAAIAQKNIFVATAIPHGWAAAASTTFYVASDYFKNIFKTGRLLGMSRLNPKYYFYSLKGALSETFDDFKSLFAKPRPLIRTRFVRICDPEKDFSDGGLTDHSDDLP